MVRMQEYPSDQMIRWKSTRESRYSSTTSIPFTHAMPFTGTKLNTILPCALGRMPENDFGIGRPSPPAS